MPRGRLNKVPGEVLGAGFHGWFTFYIAFSIKLRKPTPRPRADHRILLDDLQQHYYCCTDCTCRDVFGPV